MLRPLWRLYHFETDESLVMSLSISFNFNLIRSAILLFKIRNKIKLELTLKKAPNIIKHITH